MIANVAKIETSNHVYKSTNCPEDCSYNERAPVSLRYDSQLVHRCKAGEAGEGESGRTASPGSTAADITATSEVTPTTEIKNAASLRMDGAPMLSWWVARSAR
jgi:hypothetical protein